jgi:hypothetical protein
MNVAVELVSEQAIPNVLFNRELASVIDLFFYISTAQMEKKRKVESIISASHTETIPYSVIVVDEFNYDAILETVEKELNTKDHYFVNVTCGTKIMSMALYQIFQQYKSKIYYHGLATGNFIPLFPQDQSIEKIPINCSLSLEDYFSAYGAQIKRAEPHYTNDQTNLMFSVFYDFENSITKLRELRNSPTVRNRLKKNKPITLDDTVFHHAQITVTGQELRGIIELADLFTFDRTAINRHQIDFLTGGWFEEYLYYLCKTEGAISDEQIGIGIQLRRTFQETTVDNEFDIVLLSGTQLYIIECKSCLDKELLTNTLYKQHTFQQEFGLRVKNIIVTMSKEVAEPTWAKQRERAEVMGAVVIDGNFFSEKKLENTSCFGILDRLRG